MVRSKLISKIIIVIIAIYLFKIKILCKKLIMTVIKQLQIKRIKIVLNLLINTKLKNTKEVNQC